MQNDLIFNRDEHLIAFMLFLVTKQIVLSPRVTSIFIQRSEKSLEKDRANCSGLPYVKLGAQSGSDRVYYSVTDIAHHIVSRKVKTISETTQT